MQSEWVHSEEKKKACAGYENHVNGYNVYQDAQITPTNEDKSCLAHTSTHTFNQLRILYTAYMYTLNWTDRGRGRASVEVIIVIVIVIECWIPTTEQFHNGIVLIEIHLNGIGKYGYFLSAEVRVRCSDIQSRNDQSKGWWNIWCCCCFSYNSIRNASKWKIVPL